MGVADVLGEELVDGLLEHVAQVQRGWSAEQYRDWLAAAMAGVLLRQ